MGRRNKLLWRVSQDALETRQEQELVGLWDHPICFPLFLSWFLLLNDLINIQKISSEQLYWAVFSMFLSCPAGRLAHYLNGVQLLYFILITLKLWENKWRAANLCLVLLWALCSFHSVGRCCKDIKKKEKEREREKELILSFFDWGTESSFELHAYQTVNLDKWEQEGMVLN